MKRKCLSLILCLCLLASNGSTVLATSINKVQSQSINLNDGIILSDTTTDIKKTGENLIGPAEISAISAQSADQDVKINSASIQNNEIHLTGTANGVSFDITGTFCGISENRNVVVFNSEDKTNHFRVVYCAIERELKKASLYFSSFAGNFSEYNVVTKLYLAPNTGINGQYIMAELFGNKFPTITEENIAALPLNQELNLYWYAKEFEPTNMVSFESPIAEIAANPTITVYERYEFQHLGMTYKHWIAYEERCDVRDVTHAQTSTAGATLIVTKKWIDAELENDCSSTSSTLSLQNITIGYCTIKNTAATSMLVQGLVTRLGSLKTNFSLSIGLTDSPNNKLSTAVSTNFSWQPGSTKYDTGTRITLTTNSGSEIWRDAVACIDSANILREINNKIVVSWGYASYANTVSTGNAKIVFKHTVHNLLDYTQSKNVEHVRELAVNVT